MTILTLAAVRADLLAPVARRVPQAPLVPAVPRLVLEVPLVAGVRALGPVGQQALAVQQVPPVQAALASVAVRWTRVPTRLTHPTLLSNLDMQTRFAAGGGGDSVGFTGAHLRSGDVSGKGISSTRALASTSGNA